MISYTDLNEYETSSKLILILFSICSFYLFSKEKWWFNPQHIWLAAKYGLCNKYSAFYYIGKFPILTHINAGSSIDFHVFSHTFRLYSFLFLTWNKSFHFNFEQLSLLWPSQSLKSIIFLYYYIIIYIIINTTSAAMQKLHWKDFASEPSEGAGAGTWTGCWALWLKCLFLFCFVSKSHLLVADNKCKP